MMMKRRKVDKQGESTIAMYVEVSNPGLQIIESNVSCL